MKSPPGKSRSARAKKRDWSRLLDIVSKDSLAHPTLDFEEQYVHAIQKALHGRDNKPLLELLDRRAMIHPALLPALADVIRSQRDTAVGVGARLTALQDRNIRSYFDAFTTHVRPPQRIGEVQDKLAKLFHVSPDTIGRSLKRTESAK